MRGRDTGYGLDRGPSETLAGEPLVKLPEFLRVLIAEDRGGAIMIQLPEFLWVITADDRGEPMTKWGAAKLFT